ncbi:metal ABC transporter solute-binding protein, Zn/Mn family [Streptomyces tagetis]|uniref:ABC transporter substrate-binding protein n=1 Tax=Streptomyces tagetis TaxID=2820809 RepID=A0A940XD48_9ACTN|nr:zinc ABC transporter substrate-binding protein [Streptomyces sp. RG38]MBQ0826215.1 ABC transporter substrate-binding protein [Streptomyces sp. RG38]
MARIRVRTLPRTTVLALSTALALSATTACGSTGTGGESDGKDGGLVVVATTTWEGAFARAAGAEDVRVIVPSSAQHAPDYDPRPSDLTAVADADFVLYAPFEPYAAKIKEAAGSDAELVEVELDNDADKVSAEVTRLGKLFGTEDSARRWNRSFMTEYGALRGELRAQWPEDRAPAVVAQVYTVWAATMAGADVRGTYGPDAVTAKQLSDLSGKKPALVLDNAHMTTGKVLPDSGARQVDIVNYPGTDLDLMTVYKDAADAIGRALAS